MRLLYFICTYVIFGNVLGGFCWSKFSKKRFNGEVVFMCVVSESVALLIWQYWVNK